MGATSVRSLTEGEKKEKKGVSFSEGKHKGDRVRTHLSIWFTKRRGKRPTLEINRRERKKEREDTTARVVLLPTVSHVKRKKGRRGERQAPPILAYGGSTRMVTPEKKKAHDRDPRCRGKKKGGGKRRYANPTSIRTPKKVA